MLQTRSCCDSLEWLGSQLLIPRTLAALASWKQVFQSADLGFAGTCLAPETTILITISITISIITVITVITITIIIEASGSQVMIPCEWNFNWGSYNPRNDSKNKVVLFGNGIF